MAVPKFKRSRSNTRSRRAQWKSSPTTLTTCPRCHAAKRPHVACPSCGVYNNRLYAEAQRSEHEG